MKQPEPNFDLREDLKARGIDEANTFESVLERHMARRALLKGAAMAAPAAALPGFLLGTAKPAEAANAPLSFTAIGETKADTVTVPSGYNAQVVMAWGDALFPGMAPFNVFNQTPADQARRFGFNNDHIALFPLTGQAGTRVTRAFGVVASEFAVAANSYIMAVNHEYGVGAYQFPDYPLPFSRTGQTTGSLPTRNHVDTMMQSLGCSLVEINLVNGRWVPNLSSQYNRRITATTPMEITGPARGDELMQTPADPTGTTVLGTFANCSGGLTPWGTYLTCEENWDGYFNNLARVTDTRIKALHASWPFFNQAATAANSTDNTLFWDVYYPRFDLSTAEGLKEPFRFGFVVEIDPYDPASTPKKRTALGRFKHESAEAVLSKNNRVVVYSGDDEVFQYVYKFVSNGIVNLANKAANSTLLDDGILYVARFDANGTGVWLPLDFASVNARAPGRFRNQADVLLRCREAGDVMGATPMDRPEDLQPERDGVFNATGRVFMAMTNNSSRTASGTTGVNAANPRASNISGHIIQLNEAGGDAAATSFTWSIFLLAGNPASAAGTNTSVLLNGVPTYSGPAFGSPDNLTLDSTGNLFIGTDGTARTTPNCNDMIVATSTEGGYPRAVKRFLVGPLECEVTGPRFAPDDATLFAAIQHPGENGTLVTRAPQGNADVTPNSSWPDGNNAPPRPAVIAVRRNDGGRVGS